LKIAAKLLQIETWLLLTADRKLPAPYPTFYDLPFSTILHDWHTIVRYDFSRSSKVNDFHVIWKVKANMRLPISDQQQPRPYLSPFSHNTSMTDGGTNRRQTTTIPLARPLLKYGRLKRNHENFISQTPWSFSLSSKYASVVVVFDIGLVIFKGILCALSTSESSDVNMQTHSAMHYSLIVSVVWFRETEMSAVLWALWALWLGKNFTFYGYRVSTLFDYRATTDAVTVRSWLLHLSNLLVFQTPANDSTRSKHRQNPHE